VSTQQSAPLFYCSAGLDGRDGIIIDWDNSTGSINMNIHNSQANTATKMIINSDVIPGLYYHMVVTIDSKANVASVWVNGTKATANSPTVYPLDVTRSFCYLGVDALKQSYGDWDIDSMRVYDYVLPDDTIMNLVNVLNPATCHFSVSIVNQTTTDVIIGNFTYNIKAASTGSIGYPAGSGYELLDIKGTRSFLHAGVAVTADILGLSNITSTSSGNGLFYPSNLVFNHIDSSGWFLRMNRFQEHTINLNAVPVIHLYGSSGLPSANDLTTDAITSNKYTSSITIVGCYFQQDDILHSDELEWLRRYLHIWDMLTTLCLITSLIGILIGLLLCVRRYKFGIGRQAEGFYGTEMRAVVQEDNKQDGDIAQFDDESKIHQAVE